MKRLSIILAIVFVTFGLTIQGQAQVTIDKNGDMYVEKGLKGSFPGSAIVIDGNGYLNIGTGLKGKASPVERTGQTESYGTGDDGNLQKGAIWPNPRFTDNGNGTVTDNLTGLIWLQNADCMQFWFLDFTGQNVRSWSDALTAANALANGYCGLSDGSDTGDWRLPNRRELDSLVGINQVAPALAGGHHFLGVELYYYWTSTTYHGNTSYAWQVYFYNGSVDHKSKSELNYVWPVRGGN